MAAVMNRAIPRVPQPPTNVSSARLSPNFANASTSTGDPLLTEMLPTQTTRNTPSVGRDSGGLNRGDGFNSNRRSFDPSTPAAMNES